MEISSYALQPVAIAIMSVQATVGLLVVHKLFIPGIPAKRSIQLCCDISQNTNGSGTVARLNGCDGICTRANRSETISQSRLHLRILRLNRLRFWLRWQ